MKKYGLVLILFVVVAGSACTNKQSETESPVSMTVELEDQLLAVNPCAPPDFAVTLPTINLNTRLKSPTASDPQGFATVQVANYEVRFRRLDGGTRVPPTQHFSAGVIVQAPGTATLSGFPIMTTGAVTGTPFDQLLPFNGGIDRETGRDEIQIQYLITFFGQTVSGHRVQSETASADLIFRCL